jgi:hypothetical protein
MGMGWISLARISVASLGLPRRLNGTAKRMQFRPAAFAAQLASSAEGISSSALLVGNFELRPVYAAVIDCLPHPTGI